MIYQIEEIVQKYLKNYSVVEPQDWLNEFQALIKVAKKNYENQSKVAVEIEELENEIYRNECLLYDLKNEQNCNESRVMQFIPHLPLDLRLSLLPTPGQMSLF